MAPRAQGLPGSAQSAHGQALGWRAPLPHTKGQLQALSHSALCPRGGALPSVPPARGCAHGWAGGALEAGGGASLRLLPAAASAPHPSGASGPRTALASSLQLSQCSRNPLHGPPVLSPSGPADPTAEPHPPKGSPSRCGPHPWEYLPSLVFRNLPNHRPYQTLQPMGWFPPPAEGPS